MFRLLIALFLWPLACAAAAPAPPASPVAAPLVPALWTVSDADTKVTLFGTIHALPRGTDWFRPHVARALDSANALVLETVIPDGSSAILPIVMRLARLPAPRPVIERVPEAWRPALQRVLDDLKPPPLEWYDTWHIALTLANLAAERNGLDPRIGVEAVLTERAKIRKVPIEALESMEQQLIYFDALSEADQQQLLMGTIEDVIEGRARTDRLVADWMAGNLNDIAGRLDGDFQRSAMLKRMLLDDRNARWADWIAQQMKTRTGHLFIAVGTGHLVGPGNLIDQLRKYGLQAERVKPEPPAPPARKKRRR